MKIYVLYVSEKAYNPEDYFIESASEDYNAIVETFREFLDNNPVGSATIYIFENGLHIETLREGDI